MIRNEVLLKSEIYYEFIKDRYEISLEILLILKIKHSKENQKNFTHKKNNRHKNLLFKTNFQFF